VVTCDPEVVRRADRVVFPGVGEARSALQSLQASGLDALLPTLRQPFLGICLGMQLLCRHSEESDTPGLGVFTARVSRFPQATVSPHMGWNTLESTSGALFDGVPAGAWVYFAHGYRAGVCPETAAVSSHGGDFSAALAQDNFWGVQFHPEKSGDVGARVLRNFLEAP
jgi:glutamine amidotransferase